jgi:nucleoside-diphosphate-sugar epimerase
MNMQISIFGGGWVGNPLAVLLAQKGFLTKVSLSSYRSLPKSDNIIALDWKAMLHQSKEHWDLMCDSEIQIWTIPPRRKENSSEFYLGVIKDWIQHVNPSKVKKIIFLSSTSVYQNHNDWVNESSDLDESSLITQAEKIIATSPCPFIILRLGGLMGEERFVAKYFSGREIDGGDCPVNYVHQKDVLCVIEKMGSQVEKGIFNVVAPVHPTKKEVGDADCERRNLPKAHWISGECSSFKIVSSEKLMNELGYEFLEPNPVYFSD